MWRGPNSSSAVPTKSDGDISDAAVNAAGAVVAGAGLKKRARYEGEPS
jgi:hypothetical protein